VKGKTFLAGLTVALGLGWALSRSRRPAESPPEGPSASISIGIYDALGNLVPQNSPADLVAGGSYTARVTVTNTSTQGGVPAADTFGTRITVLIGGGLVLDTGRMEAAYAAGGFNIYDRVFYVTPSSAGLTGQVTAAVSSTALILLATGYELINVLAPAIISSASVSVGVY
jgi:hypothetical protein